MGKIRTNNQQGLVAKNELKADTITVCSCDEVKQ